MLKFKTLCDNKIFIFWGALFILGTILMFTGITRESIWFDESYTGCMAKHSIIDIIKYSSGDVHSPFYYLMVHIFTLVFGNSAFTLRAFSVLGLMALAILGIGPVRKILGNKASLIFTFLVFITPISLSVAQDARMYTWACFFVTGSILFAYLALSENKPVNWVIFGIFSIFSVYIHLYGLIEIIILYLIIFNWLLIKDRKKLIKFIIVSASVAVCYLPWFFILINQILRVKKDFWIPEPGAWSFWATLFYPFGNKFGSDINSIILNSCLVISILFIIRGIKKAFSRLENEGKLIIISLIIPILTFSIVQFISDQVRPILFPRYFFTVLGLYVIMFTYGIMTLKRKIFIAILCLALIGLYLPSLIHTYTRRYNGPMLEALDYLKDKVQPGDVFLHGEEQPFGAFAYYFPENNHYLYLPEGFSGYGNYDVYFPNGSYGHNYKSFIDNEKTVWVVNRDDDPYIYDLIRFNIYDLIMEDGFQRASITKPFALEYSWYKFSITRLTRESDSISIKPSVKTLKIKINGFKNDTGKAILWMPNRYLYDLFNEYLSHGLYIHQFDSMYFEKLIYDSNLLNESEKTLLRDIYKKSEEGDYYKFTLGRFSEEERTSLNEITDKLYNIRYVNIINNEAEIIINDLETDYYFVSVYHDENDNDELDFSGWFWPPAEGVGFICSDEPLENWPWFDRNNILLSNERETMEIQINYYE